MPYVNIQLGDELDRLGIGFSNGRRRFFMHEGKTWIHLLSLGPMTTARLAQDQYAKLRVSPAVPSEWLLTLLRQAKGGTQQAERMIKLAITECERLEREGELRCLSS